MLNTPATIVPFRGREGQLETNVCLTFTADELDAIAPLKPEDVRGLSDYSLLSDETMTRMAARILAARRLKYGG